MSATLLRERILSAAAERRPLRIAGGGTKDFFGGPLAGEVLDTRAHTGILDYDPAELVITAHGGTPLAEIESALRGKNQMLAFEPPHFGDGATIGGCVAAGLAGPRRAAAGSVRDFVLGATLLDGRGQILRFGGQVMKNVAGFDVARLLAGSLGTLGVLLDVSLKLLPRPPAEATLTFACDEAEAIRRMNTWAGQPLPVSATAWCDGVLHVRLSGAIAAVNKLCGTLGGTMVHPERAAAFWESLREHTHPRFAGVDGAPAFAVETSASPRGTPPPRITPVPPVMPAEGSARHPEPGQRRNPSGATTLWRCAVPSTAAPLNLGDTLIEWTGGQRWLRAPASSGETIRARARAVGGHAVAFRRDGDDAIKAFDTLDPPTLAIHRRLKSVFDPAGIFNRGRLHPDL